MCVSPRPPKYCGSVAILHTVGRSMAEQTQTAGLINRFKRLSAKKNERASSAIEVEFRAKRRKSPRPDFFVVGGGIPGRGLADVEVYYVQS